ncbi:hypothetical protein DL237_12680 [Pseudooceanicola sediminis]|uniref:Hedgehog/Intein (Hint) domain-containing protein n=1 Tax=Pseudooceanicola sediminis TaxID=2211117 RepID=A0A399IZC0_9RHOB|nr:Hint domain-containing protein [Pseudooceanicola sediminis]KAA2313357.1 hypothetical protein E0K93_14175 [Puniceibacterium sp. HSS470]RII38360.1 hypothetical protein DL237_12680 [Pseudooceanicola sediminis]|tara:strand:- start:6573 stop:7256 length:684 start_codon:yes stop_codon:yes gene_type:complete
MHDSHPILPQFFPRKARNAPAQSRQFPPISGLGPGTMVLTLDGEMPVEWLAAGDRILTRDRGSQPILHIARLHRTPEDRPLPTPMTFLRGEIGPQGALSEKVRVAPGHRGLIRRPEVALSLGSQEALARFEEVSRRNRSRPDPSMGGLTYHLIVMEHHEIINVGSLWVETTDPAMAARLDLPPAVRRATALLEPDAPTARHCLSRSEAQLIRQKCPPQLTLLDLLAA